MCHLGIYTSGVRGDDFFRQILLFEDVDYEKLVKMDETVDALHMRHGIDVKMHETFLKLPISHMSGDISWEKHTMDDSKLRIE